MAGIAITTASAVVFIALALAMFLGMLGNPYAGLLVFVALPAVFIIGLLLIPLGMRLQRKAPLRSPGRGRRVAGRRLPPVAHPPRRAHRRNRSPASISSSFSSRATARSSGWNRRSSAVRSATSPCTRSTPPCRTPRIPTSSASSVISVKVVEAFVHYKAAGLRQLFHIVTNNYPRPIPGVADMRPALETCGNCHWPDRSDRRHAAPLTDLRRRRDEFRNRDAP